ncbi:hypothetical protein V5O48_012927 [Marasmius crinis-equi]|uniref:PWWP domain-containing protein n=1 Tax=Marasmius crinis-equi TaxID=585013 RepID=A0ABR3F1G6_9AGAR
MSAKKGNKKETVETTYEYRDVVLGKVRGFRPWPAMVVDPESVPSPVLKERPSGKTTSTAWLTPKDISKLQKHEIEAYINEPHKQSKELLAGYRAALNPKEWEETRTAQVADADEDEEEEADGPGEVDELASGDEDGSRGKKRKKAANSAAGGTKKRKRDDTASASAGGKGGKKKGESASAALSKKSTKGGKKNRKSKAMAESEDEGGAGAEEEEPSGPASKKATPPPAKKAKKDDGEESADPEAIKVREWRHKLQKTFLSNKGPPKESEMPAMDQLFTTIETYEKMDVNYLSFSKIGKVMRHIAALTDDKVPKDDRYRFRERAKKLVDQWHLILGNTKEGGTAKEMNGAANGGPNRNHSPEDVPITNGAAEKLSSPNGLGLTGDMSMLGDVTMSEAGIDG